MKNVWLDVSVFGSSMARDARLCASTDCPYCHAALRNGSFGLPQGMSGCPFLPLDCFVSLLDAIMIGKRDFGLDYCWRVVLYTTTRTTAY
mmetsp:Transcript_12515/g.29883  ORF Transcript_12515/g.29883 Transcript_12515/m.29883 type:complete len:90 (+) Transcript_12515:2135-2404(+)